VASGDEPTAGTDTGPAAEERDVASDHDRGIALIARGEFFAAHEELEFAWRAAKPAERDYFQGLVHVAVAWYQASRGNPVGCERQLDKALRRLAPFAPFHRGVDVGDLLTQLDAARASYPATELPRVVIRRCRGTRAPG
jgi:predicted metal-dependent hydrolase